MVNKVIASVFFFFLCSCQFMIPLSTNYWQIDQKPSARVIGKFNPISEIYLSKDRRVVERSVFTVLKISVSNPYNKKIDGEILCHRYDNDLLERSTLKISVNSKSDEIFEIVYAHLNLNYTFDDFICRVIL